MKKYNLYHYIDNFLFIFSSKSIMIYKIINNFSKVCEIMKFMIEKKKNKEEILIEFLNLEINIMIIKVYLFLNKYKKILFIIIDILQRKLIFFHVLKKLLDFLSFYYAIISFNKSFLQQIFNLLNQKTHYLAHI